MLLDHLSTFVVQVDDLIRLVQGPWSIHFVSPCPGRVIQHIYLDFSFCGSVPQESYRVPSQQVPAYFHALHGSARTQIHQSEMERLSRLLLVVGRPLSGVRIISSTYGYPPPKASLSHFSSSAGLLSTCPTGSRPRLLFGPFGLPASARSSNG